MTREYLQLVRQILKLPSVPNRTGVAAKTLFGHQLRFSLRDNTLPMLTTKRMPFQTIAKELFWFMRGETNQKILEQQGIKIWTDNSTRKFLDSRGLYHYKEYETLGPIYGFQWRFFGQQYIDCHTNYKKLAASSSDSATKSVDQLKRVIKEIKTDPHSRRLIMTAWNPIDLDKMALPPCHVLVQFHVDVLCNELSAHLYQRSADLMLGVPFNITSYCLLIHIIAKMCGLKPGEFVHSFSNVHIYDTHVELAKEQLLRLPKPFPKLDINFNIVDDICFERQIDYVIDNLNCEQFKLTDYQFDPRPLKFKMVV